MRWVLVLVVACSSTARPPQPIENQAPARPPSPPSMVDQIVRAELEHWASDPAWLPDAKLLPATIPILRDVEVGRMVDDAFTKSDEVITPAALPSGAFELVTSEALQARADRAGHEVMLIGFDATFFKGTSGVHVGFKVRTMLPSSNKGPVLCCCGAIDLFEEHTGHWTLTNRRGVVCS